MRKYKSLLSLSVLAMIPSFGVHMISCSKNNIPLPKQDICIDLSDTDVPVVSKTALFDPADPKVVIDVDAAYADNYEITDINSIFCGDTELLKEDEDRDYKFERPDVDSTCMVITFLHPNKITNTLYIKPTTRYIAKHNISLNVTTEGHENDLILAGDTVRDLKGYRSEISFRDDFLVPQTKCIQVYEINLLNNDGGTSRTLVPSVDYKTNYDTVSHKLTIDFEENVIDSDVSISCDYFNRGAQSLNVSIQNKPAYSVPHCISVSDTSIVIDNPLVIMNFDGSGEKQLHKINVSASLGPEQIPPENIQYDPVNTDKIVINFESGQKPDLSVDIEATANDDLTARQIFEKED